MERFARVVDHMEGETARDIHEEDVQVGEALEEMQVVVVLLVIVDPSGHDAGFRDQRAVRHDPDQRRPRGHARAEA